MVDPTKLLEWKRWVKMFALFMPVAIPFAYFSARYDSVLILVPLFVYMVYLNWNFFR